MSAEQQTFLSLRILPARLTLEQAGWISGFTVEEIRILIRWKLLKPIGKPPPNGTKHIGTVELEKLRSDPRWLARASDTIHDHWHKKNHRDEG